MSYNSSILGRMMSGDLNPTSESYTDMNTAGPVIEEMINESGIPLGTIIESVNTDTHAGILLAMEAFELECCIGSARVVAEGVDPSIVMEGAVKNFFRTIIEKIKEFGRWIAGIFNKIFKRAKEKKSSGTLSRLAGIVNGEIKTKDGKTFKDCLEEAKSSNSNVLDEKPFRMIMIGDGDTCVAGVMKSIQKLSEDAKSEFDSLHANFITAIKDATRNDSQRDSDFNNDDKDGAQEKTIYAKICKAQNVNNDTKEGLFAYIKRRYKIDDESPVTKLNDIDFKLVVDAVTTIKSNKLDSAIDEAQKNVNKTIAEMRGFLEGMQRDADKFTDASGNSVNISQYVSEASKLSTYITGLQTAMTAVLNHMMNIHDAGLSAINGMVQAIMKGDTIVSESWNTSFYMESKEADDTPDEDAGDETKSDDVSENTHVGNMLNSYINAYV